MFKKKKLKKEIALKEAEIYKLRTDIFMLTMHQCSDQAIIIKKKWQIVFKTEEAIWEGASKSVAIPESCRY